MRLFLGLRHPPQAETSVFRSLALINIWHESSVPPSIPHRTSQRSFFSFFPPFFFFVVFATSSYPPRCLMPFNCSSSCGYEVGNTGDRCLLNPETTSFCQVQSAGGKRYHRRVSRDEQSRLKSHAGYELTSLRRNLFLVFICCFFLDWLEWRLERRLVPLERGGKFQVMSYQRIFSVFGSRWTVKASC